MKNFDELYFAVKTNDAYVNKGSFNYERGNVDKNGDISCTYNMIKFLDELIQISYCEDIASDVKKEGICCVSYSIRTNETVVGTYTFDELVKSEHWEGITKRYEFKEASYKRYKENYVCETRDDVEVYYLWGGHALDIRLNKINGEIHITSSVNGGDFYGRLYDLRLLEDNEYFELLQKSRILDLMKNHKVLILENGYVVDNVYYEDIDDYEEEEKKHG